MSVKLREGQDGDTQQQTEGNRRNARPPTYLEPLPAEMLRPGSMYLDIVSDDATYDEIKDLKKQMSAPELPPARNTTAPDNTYVLEGTNGLYLPGSGYEHLKHTTVRRISTASRLFHDKCLYVTIVLLAVLFAGAVAAIIALAVTRPHTTPPLTAAEISNCTSQLCQNGGQCMDTPGGFQCNCTSNYEGMLCEIMAMCASQPCRNNATCINDAHSYLCLCPPGYTATNCQTELNNCDSQPCLNGGACINSKLSYTCNCTAEYVGNRCEVLASRANFAFNAYITNNDYKQAGMVQFSGVSVNTGGGFDANSNMLTTPRGGLYWIHINIMTPIAQIDYQMTDTLDSGYFNNSKVGVRRQDVGQSYHDTQSRDDVVWIRSGDTFFMSSGYEYGTTFGVSSLPVAVWSVFNLDALMNPLVAFRVYQLSNVHSTNITNPFPFTIVSLNEAEAWNSVSYKFTAPVAGVYVFSYSTACLAHTPTSFFLVVDGKMLYNAQVDDTDHNGVDTASRTVPVSLQQGHSAWINGNGQQSVSDVYEMSSFKGFLYTPTHHANVIWAVHTTKQFFTNGGGSVDVSFETVGVNVGGAWSVANNHTIIPVAGTYYLHLIATAQMGTGIEMYIFINGNMEAILYRAWGGTTGPITRETALIATLQVGDIVSTRHFSGGRQGFTSFSGFLLYPIN